ncbi:MAG: hypothetical protein ACTSU2_09075 [Promethearchaeota archaeon]
MKIFAFQFNGCDKCFNETILLDEVNRVKDPKSWKPEDIDIAIITGYLLPSDKDQLDQIIKHSKRVIAYGNCSITGGVYGLAYQKGHKFLTLDKLGANIEKVYGCLGEIEELEMQIKEKSLNLKKPLCKSCSRKSTSDYLDEIRRLIDVNEDKDTCYNNLGILCMGYVSRECKEQCYKYGAPCRGCKPFADRPGFRMISMYGTLAGNIEVATEATGKGGTDKLADAEDDLTRSLPDVAGSFFRFNLASTILPIGQIPSSGSLINDIFIGRPIEELPMITGLMGGSKAISLTINACEALEKQLNIPVDDDYKKLRDKLLDLEKELIKAVESEDKKKFAETEKGIRELIGNMNLSALFFGSLRTETPKIFEYYQNGFPEGPYKSGPIEFKLNEKGIIKEFKMEEI